MLGRAVHMLVHLLAALGLIGTAAAGVAFVYLGSFHPPPYDQWIRSGVVGSVATGVLLIGTLLWGALACGALLWTLRGVQRAFRATGS